MINTLKRYSTYYTKESYIFQNVENFLSFFFYQICVISDNSIYM